MGGEGRAGGERMGEGARLTSGTRQVGCTSGGGGDISKDGQILSKVEEGARHPSL